MEIAGSASGLGRRRQERGKSATNRQPGETESSAMKGESWRLAADTSPGERRWFDRRSGTSCRGTPKTGKAPAVLPLMFEPGSAGSGSWSVLRKAVARTGTARPKRPQGSNGCRSPGEDRKTAEDAGSRTGVRGVNRRRKIHRLARPDDVRSDDLRGTRKTPEAVRPLAFSLMRESLGKPPGFQRAGPDSRLPIQFAGLMPQCEAVE